MDKNSTRKFAIYPAIGIARIGNSPDFFLSSEVPGLPPQPTGGFKDENQKVKKQVPLFRIYELDEHETPIAEIVAGDAEIEWRVHIANSKADWYQFNNALDLGANSIPSTKRNGSVENEGRKQLVIDPGVRMISGINVSGPEYKFDTGKFYDKPVLLGEIRTDEKGRLMVFGGDGKSASHTKIPAVTFANNDGWNDDISDGTVRARISVNGKTFEAKPAVVVCTPPNFGPGLFPVVSMLDIVNDLYIRNGWSEKKKKVTFYEDIFPILSHISNTQWVNEGFFMLFGKNSPSDFSSSELLDILGDPDIKYRYAREHVFRWFRDKNSEKYEPAKIPPHYGDLFDDFQNLPHVDLSVTATQYDMLYHWVEGDFETGKPNEPVAFKDMSVIQQTESLLRAPLYECLGGPFHPGIEITWIFRNIIMWEEPFRLKILNEDQGITNDYGPIITSEIALAQNGPLDGSGPGTITRWLGVPWQTDGASCLSGYDVSLYLPLPSFWSVRVPNQVLSIDSYRRATTETLNTGQKLKHFGYRVDWLRDFTTDYVTRINMMVSSWDQLGVIAPADSMTGKFEYLPESWWVETQRKEPKGTDPTFKQVLYAEKTLKIGEHFFSETLIQEDTVNLEQDMIRESKPLKRYEL